MGQTCGISEKSIDFCSVSLSSLLDLRTEFIDIVFNVILLKRALRGKWFIALVLQEVSCIHSKMTFYKHPELINRENSVFYFILFSGHVYIFPESNFLPVGCTAV